MAAKILPHLVELDKWMLFSAAARSWLAGWYSVIAAPLEIKVQAFSFMLPNVAALSLELAVKAMTSYIDPTFEPRDKHYGHHTSTIIRDYSDRIEIFGKLVSDKKLMNTVQVFEGTIETRYAEKRLDMKASDMQQIVRTAELVLSELDSLRSSEKGTIASGNLAK